ncbi:bilin-binding protein-like [Plodia interpunctella]|uniref:bilin-binding protein-like n=1 Tax=Plodia interpunctella TaxID=58824 RepID=UPI00236797F0|nr:bilin-binding protein-like [Plodia interpunctella]
MLRFFVLGLVAAATASVVHEGGCPDIKPVENFNISAYVGTWYEVSKTPNLNEQGGKCGQAEYKQEGETVKVKNSHVVDGVQKYVEGTAKLATDANKSAKLVVSLKVGDQSRETPLSVVATDYTHYAVAYSCKYDDQTKAHTDSAWILSRSKGLEGDAKKAVDNFLKAHTKEIDSTKLIVTDFTEEACKFTSSSPVTQAQAQKKQ